MSIVGSEQWMYASGEEVTQQSLKFNDDENPYFIRTPTTAGNRQTWSISMWVKRGNLGISQAQLFEAGTSGGSGSRLFWYFNSSDQIQLSSGTVNYGASGARSLRDPSAWYHILIQCSGGSIKHYINGELDITHSIAGDTAVNSLVPHAIFSRADGTGTNSMDGYLAQVALFDGTAYNTADVTNTENGVLTVKSDLSGLTFGTNGFHLTFQDDVVSEGFNAVTYKGTGADQSISGLGFEPDLVWSKTRDVSQSHSLFDTVRGAQSVLYSDYTGGESSLSSSLVSFDSDGFTVGSGSGAINNSGRSYVSWAWDAGENNAPTGHSSVTYTGNGGTQSIKGMGFEPDLVWIKTRTDVNGHYLFDTIRGADKALFSDSTSLETDYTATGRMTSFDSDGFSVKYSSSTGTNASGSKYVAWGWDAGNGSPVSNTDGSITSTVKANPATGFSITSFVGNGTLNATVGHGLSSAPEMVLVKNRSTTVGWLAWHKDLSGATYRMDLNGDGAEYNDGNGALQGVSSSLITLGSLNAVNQNSANMICYAFHSVAGYSSIGSYTGNGSSSGPTVTTGFRPGFLMIKEASSTSGWTIRDGSRNPLGTVNLALQANTSGSELTSGYDVEFTSTGFQIKTSLSDTNTNGETYIYMAFKGSYADYVSDVNTDGTIDSRVKANPAQGFSITSYTGNGTAGATVGHGLSSAPEMIIVKIRSGFSGGTNWRVYHSALGAQYNLRLNDTAAAVAETNKWNDTAPTSSVFSLGNHVSVNENNATAIAYCFNSVAGYSSIGSYTGNGSTSGPTVTTGFPVAFVMFKRTDAAAEWMMVDNTRQTTNSDTPYLDANSSAAESTASNEVDFLSNGFQLRSAGGRNNASGGTYIYMAFADTREAAFWKDVSGQGNHWTPNNLDYRDSLPDSPANNFATFNPLFKPSGTNPPTFSEGNLKIAPNAAAYQNTFSTIGASSGKWYAELLCGGTPNSANYFGVSSAEEVNYLAANSTLIGDTSTGCGIRMQTGDKRIAAVNTSYGTGFANGDIMQFALDLDNSKVYFGKNGTWFASGDPVAGTNAAFTGLSGTFFIGGSMYSAGFTSTTANFGQDSTFAGAKPMGAYTDDSELGTFQYAPPAGYLALCTANLPTPTIIDGSEHFNTVLYTGTGAAQDITVGFQTDFLWAKQRNGTAWHSLLDVVRGQGNYLYSNATNAEAYYDDMDFDSDGFTIKSNAGTALNASGSNYVAWNWKAGGAAVSNTDGSITSQVSANVDAGFSIVSWTGTGSAGTIGHSLGVQPSMIIVKNRIDARNWSVWHKDLSSNDHYLRLDSTDAQASAGANYWNSTAPTSSVFSVGVEGDINDPSDAMIAYCFANTDTTKAGSYTGNGSADGPFVYTGFRPAWVMIKRTDASDNWVMQDSARGSFNPDLGWLYADIGAAEESGSSRYCDFVSNGFKLRNGGTSTNTSGGSYIYLAFAENPFKYSNAR